MDNLKDESGYDGDREMRKSIDGNYKFHKTSWEVHGEKINVKDRLISGYMTNYRFSSIRKRMVVDKREIQGEARGVNNGGISGSLSNGDDKFRKVKQGMNGQKDEKGMVSNICKWDDKSKIRENSMIRKINCESMRLEGLINEQKRKSDMYR
ncbi:hypothetical protein [Candidatus Deianiraea vastatrix]|uniref:Uncharacterized protein n=1 Tax=Candidatus Deianiraea vastatrix TaxID=2163644 RepID=A0A5B8XEM9_9RICK|nr:hypothetical protein [Candidatus Deianiraea vastatrix]QED23700.1 hypothetical protein Deia_00913 [Candidatus Deianiraea vastatrix]